MHNEGGLILVLKGAEGFAEHIYKGSKIPDWKV